MTQRTVRPDGRLHLPTDIRVSSVAEAVALAEKWRRLGTHRWFRGQNDLWMLKSSLARQQDSSAATLATKRRMEEFCAWLEDVPELRHLLDEDNMHAVFAIMQHYGVPTHYVDFSTSPRVAGFFAATVTAAAPLEGCIICIDPNEWVGTLRAIAQQQRWNPLAWPNAVNVAVPNLRRLELQSGHFIYLPVELVERYLPYDRIVFPHDRRGFEVNPDEIYPPRKSALEERLDEFFTKELTEGNQQFFLSALK